MLVLKQSALKCEVLRYNFDYTEHYWLFPGGSKEMYAQLPSKEPLISSSGEKTYQKLLPLRLIKRKYN